MESDYCPQGHEYTSENTYLPKNGGRQCRLCRAERSRSFIRVTKVIDCADCGKRFRTDGHRQCSACRNAANAKTRTCPDCGYEHVTHRAKCDSCYRRQWRAANPEKDQAASERSRKRQKQLSPEIKFDRQLKHSYHITADIYWEIFDQQGGVCAICKKPPTEGPKGRLTVDHDHSCCPGHGNSCGGCVRGLLCMQCNNMLGCANDSERILSAAVNYLGEIKSNPPRWYGNPEWQPRKWQRHPEPHGVQEQ